MASTQIYFIYLMLALESVFSNAVTSHFIMSAAFRIVLRPAFEWLTLTVWQKSNNLGNNFYSDSQRYDYTVCLVLSEDVETVTNKCSEVRISSQRIKVI
jgi:hypothetical protein